MPSAHTADQDIDPGPAALPNWVTAADSEAHARETAALQQISNALAG
jgi:hypothetical protein